MKTKLGFISAVFFLSVSLSLISCSDKKESYKVENIDGVRIIQNNSTKWDDAKKIELQFIRKIGGLEAEDEHYIFNRPFDLVQDQQNNKYVLLWDDYRVRRFNSDWKYISSFGKNGQGPGEILRSFGFSIDKNRNIYVADVGNMKIHKFSSSGKFQKSIEMPFRSHNCGVLNSGAIVLSRAGGVIDTKDTTMLAVINLNGEILKEFVNCQKFNETDLDFYANQISFDIDKEDYIYITFLYQNRIEKYSQDGTLLFHANRPLNYKIFHRMDKETYRIPEPILTFVSLDIRIDDKGRIWVTTFDKQPESQGTMGATLSDHKRLKFEIFDKNGVLLGEVPLPIEFYKKRIYGDTLYLIDPFFEACIYEYKIIEK